MQKDVGKLLLDNLPGIEGILQHWGLSVLLDYSGEFFSPPEPSVQSRDDLQEVVHEYAYRLLGPAVARALEEQLSGSPTVLTANHHGVDYRALTVQGTIIFALSRILESGNASLAAIPVFACGTIPLSNYTFPLGISLSRRRALSADNGQAGSVRINLFPWKMSESLVGITRALSERDLTRGRRTLRRLGEAGELSAAELQVVESLLAEDYNCTAAMCQRDYSDQAVVINNRMWKKLFARPLRQSLPELAYLEMERITSSLICRDLFDPDSLYHNLLFDPSLRGRVLEAADGVTGCWDMARLDLLSADRAGEKHRSEDFRGSGTMFFWGIGGRGQRIPLVLHDGDGRSVLRGISSSETVCVALEPVELVRLLDRRRIMPSLFSSFTVLAFARGVKCCGGFYQAEYLPAMQTGLSRAVESWGNPAWASLISSVPTRNFVTGMNVVLAEYGNGTATAGAVEMMAGGGLTLDHLDKIASVTVDEANRCGLLEAYGHLLREISNSEAEKEARKRDLLSELGHRMARISLQD